MKWASLLVIAVIVVIIFLLKRTSEVSTADALEQLKNGAVVIDVRSPDEYNAEHLPGAMNLPLDMIESAVAQRMPDKGRVLLLHCQSGVRSAMATRKLRAMGYPGVFNLGSLARAREIVDKAGGH